MQSSERRRMDKLILRRHERKRTELDSSTGSDSDNVKRVGLIVYDHKRKGPRPGPGPVVQPQQGPTGWRMASSVIWQASPWCHVGDGISNTRGHSQDW